MKHLDLLRFDVFVICPVVFAASPGFSFRFKYTRGAYSMQQLFLLFSFISYAPKSRASG